MWHNAVGPYAVHILFPHVMLHVWSTTSLLPADLPHTPHSQLTRAALVGWRGYTRRTCPEHACTLPFKWTTKGNTPPRLIAVRSVPIYRNRSVPIRSTVNRLWFSVITKIGSNLAVLAGICCPIFASQSVRHDVRCKYASGNHHRLCYYATLC